MPSTDWLEGQINGIRKDMATNERAGIERYNDHERLDGDRFASVDRTLAGIGSEGTPLAIRLDRLEQKQKDRSKLMWAILSVALTLLGDRLASRIQGPQEAAVTKQAPQEPPR